MSGAVHTPVWVASNEALLVSTDHVQPWNMAIFGPEGHNPDGLVAMAWGSSPEGVQRRATLLAAAPALQAHADAMAEALEKGAQQFDLVARLGQASSIRKVDKATGKKTPVRKKDVLKFEAEEGATYLRATLAAYQATKP